MSSLLEIEVHGLGEIKDEEDFHSVGGEGRKNQTVIIDPLKEKEGGDLVNPVEGFFHYSTKKSTC